MVLVGDGRDSVVRWEGGFRVFALNLVLDGRGITTLIQHPPEWDGGGAQELLRNPPNSCFPVLASLRTLSAHLWRQVEQSAPPAKASANAVR